MKPINQAQVNSWMMRLEPKKIREALSRIKKGLGQYLWIQEEFDKRDASRNREFQRAFNAFYRVRRNSEWQKEFYQLLEANKKKKMNFGSVLLALYKKTGRMDSSFASKLVATINPEMPVIDKVVCKNLGLKLPSAKAKNRELKIIELYQTLAKEFSEFLKTENGKYLIEEFGREYLCANKVTKVKML